MKIKKEKVSEIGINGPYIDLAPKVKVSELPSMGKSYPKGTEIFIRGFTGLEVRFFSRSKGLSFKERVEKIIPGITTDMDPWKITSGDFLFLNVQRKLMSLESSKFIRPWYCPKCQSVCQSVIDPIVFKFEEIQAKELPMTVKLSFGERKASALTIGNFLLHELGEKFTDRDEKWLHLLAHYFEGDANKISEEFRTKATVKDLEILEEVDKLLFHGILPVDVVCTNSKYVNKENDHNITWEELRSMDPVELIQWGIDKGVLISDSMVPDGDLVFNRIIDTLGIATKEVCGNHHSLSISGSENLIMPFRESGELLDNCISFGVHIQD